MKCYKKNIYTHYRFSPVFLILIREICFHFKQKIKLTRLKSTQSSKISVPVCILIWFHILGLANLMLAIPKSIFFASVIDVFFVLLVWTCLNNSLILSKLKQKCPREREHEPAQADLKISTVVVVTIVIFISMENLLFLLCNILIIIIIMYILLSSCYG